jgi:hypothetical protein
MGTLIISAAVPAAVGYVSLRPVGPAPALGDFLVPVRGVRGVASSAELPTEQISRIPGLGGQVTVVDGSTPSEGVEKLARHNHRQGGPHPTLRAGGVSGTGAWQLFVPAFSKDWIDPDAVVNLSSTDTDALARHFGVSAERIAELQARGAAVRR